MSDSPTYQCEKCGELWLGNEASKCPACSSLAATHGWEKPCYLIECPCGHKFDGDKSPIRPAKEQRGHFLTAAVRQHSTTGIGSRYEHQCPKCKLWFDDVDDRIL